MDNKHSLGPVEDIMNIFHELRKEDIWTRKQNIISLLKLKLTAI